MSTPLLEVHVGLTEEFLETNPDTTCPLFTGFDWRGVYGTSPGQSEGREYLGHAVTGRLGSIGTANPDMDDFHAFIGPLVPHIAAAKGSRLEVELLRDEQAGFPAEMIVQGLRRTLKSLCLPTLEPVPAPRFERHIKIPGRGRAPDELSESIPLRLRGVSFFELTIFGPDQPKAIVTVGGNQISGIELGTQPIMEALVDADESFSIGAIERIVSCWRPTQES